MEALFIFKLRGNIDLEGDLVLAEKELTSLLGEARLAPVQELTSLASKSQVLANLEGPIAIGAHVRQVGVQGYSCSANIQNLQFLVERLTFVQAIYCIQAATEASERFAEKVTGDLSPLCGYIHSGGSVVIFAVPLYAFIELADVTVRRSKGLGSVEHRLDTLCDGLLGRSTAPQAFHEAESALSAKRTTSHLSHDIHYYKAKFFPRLVRSTLNICMTQLDGDQHRVIDNFCGSGTTMLEAALLGLPSVGMDVDPLSVLIARTKLEILRVPSSDVRSAAVRALEVLQAGSARSLGLLSPPKAVGESLLSFPVWLMKNRKMTDSMAKALLDEIRDLKNAVSAAPPELRGFFQVLMSDAISRRIRMRFLGTGVGRFSLTFSKRTMAEIFEASVSTYVRVVEAVEWMRGALGLKLAEATAVLGDARCPNDDLGRFDILLTSPPYLPAASGRESYAKARAPSLISLGMSSRDELDKLVADSIGSMNGNSVSVVDLTEREREVVDWLSNNELRSLKALPTARYFLDMRKAFQQMSQLLRPGGMAVVVSGKQSTFYEFKTRALLYVVPSAELLAEEARTSGLQVESLQDIKLQKANRNARPRSLDDYFETMIVLRKPD